MFLKVTGFMHGDPIIINSRQVVRVTGMKENKGSILTMTDGAKMMVENPLDDIFAALGSQRGETYDLTKTEVPKNGAVHCGTV